MAGAEVLLSPNEAGLPLIQSSASPENKRKSGRWTLVASLVLVVCAAVAVTVGVVVLSKPAISRHNAARDVQSQRLRKLSPAMPYPIPISPGLDMLPLSTTAQLLRLLKDCDGARYGLARSFNGEPWEPVLPGLPGRVELSCNQFTCTVVLPNDGSTYCVEEVDTSGVPTSAKANAARFLSQATFGPTRSEIKHLQNDLQGSVSEWITEQLAIPPSYLREHYRSRVNPKQTVENPIGTLRSACEVGSRWHGFAFEFLDQGKEVTILDGFATVGWYSFIIDGVLITEMEAQDVPIAPDVYKVCDVVEHEGVGATVKLSSDDCNTKLKLPNPLIHFETTNPAVLDFSAASLVPHPAISDVVFLDAPLVTCTDTIVDRTTIMTDGTAFYRHDPRIKMLENTLQDPADVTTSDGACPSVVQTFLNADTCVRRPSCSPPVFKSTPVTLNNATLRSWYRKSDKYVYFVTGLRLEDPFNVSPCVSGVSRWKRTASNCPNPTTTMDPDTLVTITAALAASSDSNKFVRDIQLSGNNCVDSAATIGAQIEVNGECFEHVHPNLYDVRDFSTWVLIHDGNVVAEAAGRPNPIARWAKNGLTYLEYPWHHPMTNFALRESNIPVVGRFGDVVDFTQMSTELQTVEMAERVGALAPGQDFEACGSPGEVENKPHLGHWYIAATQGSGGSEINQLDWPIQPQRSKSMVWTNVVFSAADQLRQRVAWVLSQILVTSDSIGRPSQNEVWITYYDILVKHAFGNYRDIIKEVTYSPLMADYLSYRQNKAFIADGTFPDENYAREIMQLFTIGLWKLGDDGLPLKDSEGNKIPTYTNEDIVAFARIWTGFDRQNSRPNIESENGNSAPNTIDPMQIKPQWRDPLPKTKLDEGYIGDGFPLCHDLPAQHFLREGAQYEFLGEASLEGDKLDSFSELPDEVFEAEMDTLVVGGRIKHGYVEFRNVEGDYIEWEISSTEDRTVSLRAYYYLKSESGPLQLMVNGEVITEAWGFPKSGSNARLRANDPVDINLVAGINTIRLTTVGHENHRIDFIAFGGDGAIRKRLEPNPETSELYGVLCGAPSSGTACTFPAQVTLDANLACDGDECAAGRVIIVAINDNISGARRYYRYRPRPCVRFPVFDQGHVTVKDKNRRQCTADYMEKSVTCCVAQKSYRMVVDLFAGDCLYANEAVRFDIANARCAARGGQLCPSANIGWTSSHKSCAEDTYMWTSSTCSPKIQVYQDGYIGLIDDVTTDQWEYMESSRNTFRVRWADETAIPMASTGCGAGCSVVAMTEGDTCVCDIVVDESIPFTDVTSVPSVEAVVSTLSIGSVSPSTYNSGMYVECSTACSADVRVWTLASNPNVWNDETIFEIPPSMQGGPQRYFKNKISRVVVNGQSEASFRNPPSFMPSLGEQEHTNQEAYLSDSLRVPEAEHEVEATLDHFFEHPSTGPFVALRLIQQMVTSNPSPTYVERVVAAFKSGLYDGYGSGQYGDLKATVAAVLLDKEARTEEYEADPNFGHGFEPLLKLLSVVRALEWQPAHGQELALKTEDRIGMEAFSSPSVFGFYRPEFSAEGAVGDAGLVSPELQLAQQPLIINFLNGMASLFERGLSSCRDGLGYTCRSEHQEVGYEGFLSARAAGTTGDEVANELALLLTQDRMHASTRQVISEVYTRVSAEDGVEEAQKAAEKLAISCPEFHTSALNHVTDTPREDPADIPSQGRKFKAIVVLFENGGCDSFNVLVPKDNCRNGHDYYSEYASVRTNGAIAKKDLLDITIPTGSQPCDTFGVNKDLPIFKQLHDLNEGAFVANIGALVEPVTKAEYTAKAKRLPPSLFAHNAQQEALATVDSENTYSKGVLGRTVQALLNEDVPYKTELFSISGNQKLLEGSDQLYDIVDRKDGIKRFRDYDDLAADLEKMTANVSQSIFADTYSKLLRSSLKKTEAMGALLDQTSTETVFQSDSVSQQFEQVSKLIKLNKQLDTERAVFVVSRGGFDSHGTFDLSKNFQEINAGLTSFVNEMKEQEMWDDVVVFTVSDFGRTLTSNGQGSDHAWGGNHFVAGGKINGGKMYGRFPDSLEADGELNIGRGRLIPTTPWEGIWEGIIQWFGVNDVDKSEVLPNLANFPAEQRYDASELFSAV